MKTLLCILALLGATLTQGACSPDDTLSRTETPAPEPPGGSGNDPDDAPGSNEDNDQTMTRNITLKAGAAAFAVTMADNAAAKAFVDLLPMTVRMNEMNGNEKYYNLPQYLPTDAFRPGTIRTGDLLLFGSSTVVLFYETYSSSYSYTRLGRIDNPDGLAVALGRGDATVTFEINR